MTPWLDDGDVRLYHGDALETLRGMADGSVDCVVTSPPYWGLRDYGTGSWDGGDPDCDHIGRTGGGPPGSDKQSSNTGANAVLLACKCGATRVDRQLGLEPTPDEFVTRMVAVFREVRRVLADHGTCWVNLGDSYYADTYSNRNNATGGLGGDEIRGGGGLTHRRDGAGLKPKDLVGIPWRVAFALQADGWYLRSDIIWAKPNPMPESVTDRPTKAHEYVFMLTKRPRYWFDSEAVREPATYAGEQLGIVRGQKRRAYANGREPSGNESLDRAYAIDALINSGRNIRSVWQIATQPYPEAHFATFPEELARRCILAGCPVRVCRVCGKPSERIVASVRGWDENGDCNGCGKPRAKHIQGPKSTIGGLQKPTTMEADRAVPCGANATEGWSDCGHNNWRPGVTLDPFIGSGTVAKVARDHQRHAIGIDLSAEYLELAARRLQQLSLLT